jgi:hypothetical protein
MQLGAGIMPIHKKQVELWLLASSASAQPPLLEDLVAQIVKEIQAP